MSSPKPPPFPPEFRHRFRVVRPLGQGAEGQVFEVEDLSNGVHHALKVIPKEGGGHLQELRRLCGFWHPGIVRVVDLLVSDATTGLLLEYVEGPDLRTWFRTAPPEQQDAVAYRLLDALEALHRAGVVHGDIKPSNILVRTQDGDPQPVLLDLGMSHNRGERSRGGTPAYMAPEILTGESPTPSTDLFSLGASLLQSSMDSDTPPRSPPPDWQATPLLRLLLPRLLATRSRRFEDATVALRAVSHLVQDLAPVLPPSFPFVGRDGPLFRLAEGARQATSDLLRKDGWTAHIDGPRGSGRTRLLHELLIKLRLQQIPTVWVDSRSTAIGVVREVLEQVETSPSTISRTLEHLERRIADPAGPPLAEQAAAAVLRAAQEHPLVMLVRHSSRPEGEDISALVRHLMAIAPSDAAKLRWAIVVAGPWSPSGREPDERIVLSPWTRPETEELLGKLFPAARSDAVRRLSEALHRVTDGLPRAVHHTLRHLAGTGRLTRDLVEIPDLPDRLSTADLGSWPNGLTADEDRLLLALCLRGNPITRSEAARLDDRENAALESLRRRGWLQTVAGSAAWDLSILPDHGQFPPDDPLRAHAHALWGRIGDDAATRLRHRCASGEPVDNATVESTIAAVRQQSPRRALELLETVLATVSTVPTPLRLQRADLLAACGLRAEAEAEFRELAAESSGDAAAIGVGRLAEQRAASGDLPGARDGLVRALATPGLGDAAQARLQVALADIHLRLGEAFIAQNLAATASQTSAPDVRAAAQNLMGLAAAFRGDPVEAARHLTAARESFVALGFPLSAAGVEANLAMQQFRLGDGAGARTTLDHAEDACAGAGFRRLLGQVLNNRGIVERSLGRPDVAAQCLERASTILSEVGEPLRAAMVVGSLGIAQQEGGRWVAAARTLADAHSRLTAARLDAQVLVLAARARLSAAMGSRRRARRLASQAIRLARKGTLRTRLEAQLSSPSRVRVGQAARLLQRARRSGDPRLLSRTLLLAAEVRGLRSSSDPRNRVAQVERLLGRVPLRDEFEVQLREHLAHIAPEQRAHHLARGLSAAARRRDPLGIIRLSLPAVHHLLERGRHGAARRRYRRFLEALTYLEDGMTPRRSAFARATLLGDELQRLQEAIEDRLRWLGRSGSPSMLLERRELLTAIGALGEEETQAGLLDRILAGLLRLTRAERSLIVLLEGDSLVFTAARHRSGRKDEKPALHLSTTVIHEVVASGKSLVVADASQDPRFSGLISVASQDIRAVACVPLRVQDRRVGAIYLDGGFQEGVFDLDELPVVEAFANLAGLAIFNLRRRDRLDHDRTRLAQELDRELQLREVRLREAKQARAREGADRLLGTSVPFREMDALIEKAATTELPILVSGESGTGKELVARAIHDRSRRQHGPWVAESCANIQESLFESEFFGHEKGAFTGATTAQPGLVRMANGGTLFLDEIGELPLALQARLLRVLEEKVVRPVGGLGTIPVDFRLVSATNRDLETEVREGRFREDLYYRLRGIQLEVPPLRLRKQDIPLLCEHFLRSTGRRLSERALSLIEAYPWPGNIRQLRNELQRASFLCGDGKIEPAHLGPEIAGTHLPDQREGGASLPLAMTDWERWAIEHALRESGGDRKHAAALLGISRSTLYAKLERLKL